MKSYFLNDIDDLPAVADYLDQRRPAQRNPWIQLSDSGDVMAYFNISPQEREVSADISGRQHFCDARVAFIRNARRESRRLA